MSDSEIPLCGKRGGLEISKFKLMFFNYRRDAGVVVEAKIPLCGKRGGFEISKFKLMFFNYWRDAGVVVEAKRRSRSAGNGAVSR